MDSLKRAVALEAAAGVESGSVVGLGSGSTMAYFIAELGRRVREEGLAVVGVPTSYQARALAREHGVPVRDPLDAEAVDLAIDGADEVDPAGNLIKGAGAAHVLEKVVASLARRFVVVVDESKLVPMLGTRFPVPVEVVPPALPLVLRCIERLEGKARVREGSGKVGPVVSDLGNVVVDARFGPIRDPAALARELDAIPGVVGHGLFVGMAGEVLVARGPAGRPRVERSFPRAH